MSQIGTTKRNKSTARMITTTLFFAGVVASAVALYMLPAKLDSTALIRIYSIVGITFLAGLLALHLTARSIKETIVYLEHQKEERIAEVADEAQSQLTMESIDRIIASRQEGTPQRIINELCQQLQAGLGAIYVANERSLELKYGFALSYDNNAKSTYNYGEGLVGRVAAEGNSLYIDKLPGDYITIFSGLGSSSPSYLVIVPIKNDTEVLGAIEIAMFTPLNKGTIRHLEQTGRTLAEIAL